MIPHWLPTDTYYIHVLHLHLLNFEFLFRDRFVFFVFLHMLCVLTNQWDSGHDPSLASHPQTLQRWVSGLHHYIHSYPLVSYGVGTYAIQFSIFQYFFLISSSLNFHFPWPTSRIQDHDTILAHPNTLKCCNVCMNCLFAIDFIYLIFCSYLLVIFSIISFRVECPAPCQLHASHMFPHYLSTHHIWQLY